MGLEPIASVAVPFWLNQIGGFGVLAIPQLKGKPRNHNGGRRQPCSIHCHLLDGKSRVKHYACQGPRLSEVVGPL